MKAEFKIIKSLIIPRGYRKLSGNCILREGYLFYTPYNAESEWREIITYGINLHKNTIFAPEVTIIRRKLK